MSSAAQVFPAQSVGPLHKDADICSALILAPLVLPVHVHNPPEMRAYVHDGLPGPSIAAHDSGRAVSEDTLAALGLIARPSVDLAEVDAIAAQRGYKCRDEISVSKAGLGDAYEAKLKSFFEEHLHNDEEIRWMREGAGYFDVRDATDKEWIRVRLEAGDLLVLPPGIYHRFTLDEGNFARAMRLFQEEPKWTPYPRGQDTEVNPYRQEYVSKHLASGISVA